MTTVQSTPKIVLAGLGAHGINQARAILEHPDKWKLAAVVDGSVAARARFQSRYHRDRVPYFRDLDSALGAVHADLLIISTTAPSHVDLVRRAIGSGRCGRVLVEKPISNDLDAARELSSFLDSEGRLGDVYVDFTRRASNLYRDARDWAHSGIIGEAQSIEYNYPVKLSMDGSHFFDLANWIFGEKAISIQATLDTFSDIDHRGSRYFDPAGEVEVIYAGGQTLRLGGRNTNSDSEIGFLLRCSHGQIFIDAPRESRSHRFQEDHQVHLESDRNTPFLNWFCRMIDAVTKSPDQDNSIIATVSEGIQALEMVTAAHLSHQSGGNPIPLPLGDLVGKPLRVA